jgi:hypothetical protein
MSEGGQDNLLGVLALAFGGAEDVTPAPDQPRHILLPELEIPSPWAPSLTRAMTVWRNWPGERPEFFIDTAVVGETNQPPRSNTSSYVLGEPWRSFSFTFPWAGDDPVLAVQLWLTRFIAEPV